MLTCPYELPELRKNRPGRGRSSTKRLIGGALLFAWIAYAVYVSTTMSAKRDEAKRSMDAIRREHQSREAMDRTMREATAIRP